MINDNDNDGCCNIMIIVRAFIIVVNLIADSVDDNDDNNDIDVDNQQLHNNNYSTS